MKRFAQTLSLVAALTTTCLAAPLQKQEISADAKWVVHLDVDKLRSTSETGKGQVSRAWGQAVLTSFMSV